MAFKIGEAYVEVVAKVNKDSIRRDIDDALSSAEKSASKSGSGIGSTIGSKISDGISTAMSGLNDKIEVKIKETGKRSGSSLLSSIGSAVKSGATTLVSGLGDALSTGLRGAATAAGPVLIGILGGIGAAAGPALGAALGGSLILGLGGAFTAIGVLLLSENKKISQEFGRLAADIKQVMTDASKPLLPTMRHAMEGVKSLVKEFNPIFKKAFSDAEIPLKNFIDKLLAAFKNLKPAVAPIMQGFTDVLSAIGPHLDGIFKSIGEAFSNLGRVVSENKTVIGTVFVGLLNTIPAVINAISGVVSFFGTLLGVVNNVNVGISRAFVGATTAVLGFVEKLLGGLRQVAEAMGNIPGMEKISQNLVKGIDTALGKVGEWKRAAQEAGKAVELKANIFDLQQKIDKAKALLNDPKLKEERKAQINADIAKLQQKKAEAVRLLGDPALIKEYKSSINTEIATLKARLSEAKRELQDPELRKERRSKLNADIAQLKSQIAAAKSAIASVQGKTVTITVNTIYNNSKSANAAIAAKVKEIGGIERYASGAVRRSTAPNIAKGPTILYGEGRDDEAFIPYDRAMRGRATRILGQVADDFGFSLTPARGAGSGSGGSTTNNFYVTLNARDMAEMRTTMDFFNKVQSMARAGAR